MDTSFDSHNISSSGSENDNNANEGLKVDKADNTTPSSAAPQDSMQDYFAQSNGESGYTSFTDTGNKKTQKTKDNDDEELPSQSSSDESDESVAISDECEVPIQSLAGDSHNTSSADMDSSHDSQQTQLMQDAKLQEQILRLQADIENMHRRHQQDLSRAHAYGLEKCFRELMPVVDSLAMALDNTQEDHKTSSLFTGVELTSQMLKKALSQFGLTTIAPSVGESFTPERHEAITTAPSDAVAPNSIVQVVQCGFMLNDRLLRPARVIVSVKTKESKA